MRRVDRWILLVVFIGFMLFMIDRGLSGHLSLTWDPQIRGMLIVITGVTLLIGSVYLLLATNTGARLGLLLALAGLSGWLMIMGMLWTVNVLGQGFHGKAPTWDVQQILQGNFAQANTVKAAENFPAKWHKLAATDTDYAGIAQASDSFLIPPAQIAGSESAPPAPLFKPPFTTTQDYLVVNAYEIGGDKYLPGGMVTEARQTTPASCGTSGWLSHVAQLDKKVCRAWRKTGFLHKPHYAVVQVEGVKVQPTVAGQAPPKPAVDSTKPIYTVVLYRNSHHPVLPFINLRLNFISGFRALPLSFTILMAVIFGCLTSILHNRDKEIMARDAAAESATTA